MELFPAILIGGPPHSGKSVLAYSLTKALREAEIEHYLLRAAPDGEGDWANEIDQQTVRAIRVKGAFSDAWTAWLSRDIVRRHLPLLVDVGGQPTPDQEEMFSYCTHAILLTPDAESLATWRQIMHRQGVPILAELRSSLDEADVVLETSPILRGVLAGLERGRTAAGPTFAALLQKITPLLHYPPAELRRRRLASAPTDNPIELEALKRTLGMATQWAPSVLPRLFDYLSQGVSLAVDGRCPNWLCAALALHAYPGQFYQFDPRLGWVTPPALRLGPTPAASPLQADHYQRPQYDLLQLSIPGSYLDYAEAANLPLPPLLPLKPGRGLVISGRLPNWLLTAAARLYRSAPWLAIYQPQLENQAVIIASTDPALPPGNLLPVSPGDE